MLIILVHFGQMDATENYVVSVSTKTRYFDCISEEHVTHNNTVIVVLQ